MGLRDGQVHFGDIRESQLRDCRLAFFAHGRAGNQGTSTITTTISGGFSSSIALSATGLPSGTTANFNLNPIPAPGSGSSPMTINVGSSTPAGTYPITVTGNGGGIQQYTTVTLTVTAAHFAICASPSSLTVAQGNQGTSTITTTISGGFNSSIALSATGLPSGTTANFNPNPIPAPGSGSSTDDHHGRHHHSSGHLSHHGNGQRRRHPAIHHGHADGDGAATSRLARRLRRLRLRRANREPRPSQPQLVVALTARSLCRLPERPPEPMWYLIRIPFPPRVPAVRR